MLDDLVQILLIIPTGVYGGVTVLAGVQQFRDKLIQGWAAVGLALVGLLMLVSAVLLWQASNSGITVLVLALLSLHSRRHEFDADAYAASHSSAAELVQALLKL